jgi:hypothetical protein
MAIPYLTHTDMDSNTYDFNNNFIITGKSVNATRQVLENAYSAGGKDTGDGFPRSTVISVAGTLTGESLADMETKERALKQAVQKDGYLSLSTDVVSRRYRVSFAGISETSKRVDSNHPRHLDQLHKDISVKFLLECPYMEDVDATDDDNVLAGDHTVSISNGGDSLVKPVITIDADQGVDIPTLTITNTTDGSISFEYTDSSFLSGSSLEIDCDAGTVKRDGGDTVENFTGNFLRLLTGSNSIDYEGAACTLTFTFRKKYL